MIDKMSMEEDFQVERSTTWYRVKLWEVEDELWFDLSAGARVRFLIDDLQQLHM
jgi:hypothetical protein